MNNLNFRDSTIRQIRFWAWAAAVFPITALAGIFFIWRFGPNSWFDIAIITGETVMFGVAVIWWWWAMYTLRNLVKQWDITKEKVVDVSKDIKDIKSVILDTLREDK